MKSLFIKLIVTVIIFSVIYQNIDFDKFIYILSKSNGLFILFALMAQYLSTYIAAYRWYLIMQTLGYRENFKFFNHSYFKGTFFNQALPSTIGGDAVRVVDLINNNHRKKQAFFDVLIDRVIGLFGLLLLSLMANLIFPNLISSNIYWLIVIISSFGVMGVVVLIYLSKFRIFRKYKLTKLFYQLSLRFSAVLAKKDRFFIQISLTIMVHFFTIVAFYCLAYATQLHVNFYLFLVLVPSVLLITIAPISLAGWGIRESAMIGMFVMVGVDKTAILSVSILYGLLLMLVGIYGAIFLFKK